MAGYRLRLVLLLLAVGLGGFGAFEMAWRDSPRERSSLASWSLLAGIFCLALLVAGAAIDYIWGPQEPQPEPGPQDTAGWFFGEQPQSQSGRGEPKGRKKARVTVAQSVRLLEEVLAREPLTPARIWEVFRQWADLPVACDAEELGASVGYADGAARVEFRRTFKRRASGRERTVALVLSSERGDAPRLPDAGTSCEDREGLPAFFARVEELPGFTPALAYPHWTFAVERD